MTKGSATAGPERARSGHDARFERVAAAFAGDPAVSRGRMFSSDNILSVKGKIFAMLVRGEFVAKLPRDRVDAMVRANRGRPFDPGHGRLMKEWLVISPGRAGWLPIVREAYRYVRQGGSADAPRA